MTRVPNHLAGTLWLFRTIFTAGILFSSSFARADEAPQLPPTDRVWDSSDYYRVGHQIVRKVVPLPTFADESGKRILHRFTARENLQVLLQREKPVKERLESFLTIFQYLEGVVGIYKQRALAGDAVQEEYAILRAAVLRGSCVGLQLGREFFEGGETHADGEGRVRTIVNICNTFFTVGLMSLTEDSFLTDRGKLAILTVVEEVAPTFLLGFATTDVNHLREHLQKVEQSSSAPEVKATVNLLLEMLRRKGVEGPNDRTR